MVAWYKHDIPAWMNGTEDLDSGPYRVYHVVCQLIYMNEGPIALNERGIAGRCNQRIDRFRVHLKVLIDLGKLSVVDGKLFNERCSSELGQIDANRANASKGGRAPRRHISDGSQTGLDDIIDTSQHGLDVLNDMSQHGLSPVCGSKTLKTNDEVKATLKDGRSLKTREEETREEKKEEHCPDAKAPRTKQVYSEEFDAKFWQPYPRTPTMSKSEAWKAWQKLTAEQRVASCQAIEPYKRHLRSKPTLETVHACRFLSQQRFEGFVAGGSQPSPVIDIRSSLV